MSQSNYIKDIAKYGLENDQEKLLSALNELIDHSKKTKKLNFAIQLQSILKESLGSQRSKTLTKVGSESYFNRIDEREISDLILEKLTSDYRLENIVADAPELTELNSSIEEHMKADLIHKLNLPIANILLINCPSGCGKTLASYVIAGELNKMMVVVNLGAIVSSKLGETSKNLAKIFRREAAEDCIIFIDEFDSLGKVRDYSQYHGEMKRVVNSILQLFDYLPQNSIVIAATNQKDMLDDALLRRFDFSIEFGLPNDKQIEDLISITLKKGYFRFDNMPKARQVIKKAVELSFYSIKKTLITALKRSLFQMDQPEKMIAPKISTSIWEELLKQKKIA